MFGTLCQISKTRPATIHLTAIDVDGQAVELHISQYAARRLGLDLHNDPPGPKRIRELIALGEAALDQSPHDSDVQISQAPSLTTPTGATTLSCPECGLTYSAFTDNNRFGCANCYTAFSEHLGKALEDIHGARVHIGRVPGANAPDPDNRAVRAARLARLRHRLEQAVADERYEEAATLRDQIQQEDESGSQS